LTSRELRAALQEELRIGRSWLYQKANEIKVEQVLPRLDEAFYLMAVDAGLDLSKYLDVETVHRVRQLHQARRQATAPQPRVLRTTTGTKTVTVATGKDIKLEDPLLDKRTLDDAKVMADRVYPVVYVLENSVRELIRRVLKSAYGDGWWGLAATDPVKKKVQERRAKEVSNPWHGRRGAQEIFYTDLGDLASIVTSNHNWQHFQRIFPSQRWLTQKLDEIEMSRNVMAHCNPLRQHDIARLKFYLADWQSQIGGVRHLIP